jgi:hypothetical protein
MSRSFCFLSHPPLCYGIHCFLMRPFPLPVSLAFLSLYPISRCVLPFLLSRFRYLQFVTVRHDWPRNKERRLTLRTNQLHYCNLIPPVGMSLHLHAQSNIGPAHTSTSTSIIRSLCVDRFSYSKTTERCPLGLLPSTSPSSSSTSPSSVIPLQSSNHSLHTNVGIASVT